jgi:hypothetical protein
VVADLAAHQAVVSLAVAADLAADLAAADSQAAAAAGAGNKSLKWEVWSGKIIKVYQEQLIRNSNIKIPNSNIHISTTEDFSDHWIWHLKIRDSNRQLD